MQKNNDVCLTKPGKNFGDWCHLPRNSGTRKSKASISSDVELFTLEDIFVKPIHTIRLACQPLLYCISMTTLSCHEC